MTIGDQIKEARIAKGWTQADLAEQCGISLRTIQRMENGNTSPSLFTQRKLQEALGIQFLTGLSEGPKAITQTKSSKRMQTVSMYLAASFLGIGAVVSGYFGFFNETSPLANSKSNQSLIEVATVNCNTESSCDIEVTRKDEKGNILWQKILGGSSYDKASGALATSDGGFLVLGSTSSYGQGNYDVLLIKLDQKGEFVWQKTYGGFFNDYGKSIEVSQSGNSYVIQGSRQTCTTPNVSENCQMLDWEFEIDPNGETKG